MKTEPPETIVTQENITPKTVRNAFVDWIGQKSRYDTLYRYYIGDQDFPDRDGNRIVSNFCAYISKALRGYMVGNQPKYVCAEDDSYGQQIIDLMHRQTKWSVDSQLALDMSIYGKAFELVYLPKDKTEPNSVVVSPRNAFVAYTGDMERDSVFGAVIYSYRDEADTIHYTMYMYDRQSMSVWESVNDDSADGWRMIQDPVPHGFGRVPLIEYRNSRDMLGDFEGVMDLQDAYNSLLSDRQDDKDAFAQTMLFIQGSIIGATPEEIEQGKEFLKRTRVLQGDDDTTATWLTKTMDETGIQVLQDQYANDIHKFAMVPDLSDEQFAGNASGIAMAYKMFGTDQMMAEKTARFREGFIRRVKLYDYRMNNPSMSVGYEPRTDIESMDIIFQFNAPQDLSYMATALTQLTSSGIMSKATARMQISAIPDPIEEAELVEEEASSASSSDAMSFEDDATRSLGRMQNPPMDDEDEDDGEGPILE